MKKLVCELCEGSDFTKENGFFVCQNCGCKYTTEEAKKLMQDSSSPEQQDATLTNNTKVDSLLKIASDIIIVYVNRIDDSGNKTHISEPEYYQAQKCLEQAAEIAPDNWNVWFLKGLLAELENYDPKAPSALQEFERAVRAADDETILTRILPHVARSEKEYIRQYESEDYLTFGDCQPDKLIDYYKFFSKFDIASDYANEASQELERLQPLAEKRKATLEKEYNDRNEKYEAALANAIAELKEYEAKTIAAHKEIPLLKKACSELRAQIDDCGFFDQKKKEELSKLYKEKNSRWASLQTSLGSIEADAFWKYLDYTGGIVYPDYAYDSESRNKYFEEHEHYWRLHYGRYCREIAENGSTDLEDIETMLRNNFVYNEELSNDQLPDQTYTCPLESQSEPSEEQPPTNSSDFDKTLFIAELDKFDQTTELNNYVSEVVKQNPDVFSDALLKDLDDCLYIARVYGNSAGLDSYKKKLTEYFNEQ